MTQHWTCRWTGAAREHWPCCSVMFQTTGFAGLRTAVVPGCRPGHLLRNGLQLELGLHYLPRLDSNTFSPLLPSRLLHCRPAWYDLPPPPYSSDTESLNQADLPPYRSRSGSAYSASSQAASSLLSVEGSSHSPEQPGPAEGTSEPRDSVPSQGTEEV